MTVATCNIHNEGTSGEVVDRMRKLLKPGDVLLLGLAGALDVFEEVKDPFGLMARGSEFLYTWVPPRYRRHNFYRVVARQLKTGDLEKVVKGDDVYLRLTSAGREKVVRDFPLLSWVEQPWDKRWRIVIFDIAETDRNARKALRDKLRQLGFGMLQESVWITPHDVGVDLREFLESNGMGETAFVLEVSAILAGNQEALVRKVWNLDALEESYQDIIDDVAKLKDMYVASDGRNSQHTSRTNQKGMGKETTKEKVSETIGRIRRRYIETLLSDPCLPRDLLPKDWPAAKARRAVQGLEKIIAS